MPAAGRRPKESCGRSTRDGRSPMDISTTLTDKAEGSQDAALFVARLGLASLFLFSGTQKLLSLPGGQAAAYAASVGVPFPHLAMPLVCLFEIGAGLMLVTGWRAQSAATALALYIA